MGDWGNRKEILFFLKCFKFFILTVWLLISYLNKRASENLYTRRC